MAVIPISFKPADGSGRTASSRTSAKLAAARAMLKLRKSIASADVQEELQIDAPNARAILKHLVEIGVATVEGKARGTRYRRAGK